MTPEQVAAILILLADLRLQVSALAAENQHLRAARNAEPVTPEAT